MDRFISLLRILLIKSFGISAFKARAKIKRREYLKFVGIGAAFIIGFAPAVYIYCKILSMGFDFLLPLGQEGAILSLGIVLVSAMVFYFGIFYVINSFYFGEDTEIFLALPLRPWQVIGARFSVVLCYEYLTEIPFLLPPLIIFGIKSGAPFIYWLYALVAYLSIPILPLAMATLPTIIMMRFTNLGKRKDLLRIFGGLTIIVLAIGFQFLFQNANPQNIDPGFLQGLYTGKDGLINLISRVFPSSRFISLALVESSSLSGFINLLYFLGLSVLTLTASWLLGEKMYFQGLIGSGETVARRRQLKSSDYRKVSRVSPVLLSYLFKEIRLLIRTPVFFMNCVLSNLFMPILILIPFLLQSRGNNEGRPLPWEALSWDPRVSIIVMAIITGLTVFLVAANGITATSLSREGKQFYISKFIPLSYKQQILAKLLSGFIFSGIAALLIIIVASILLKIDIILAGIILLVTLLALVSVLETGLIIDIHWPKLDWDNEQKAVKQNFNALFTILISVLLVGAIAFITIKYIYSLAIAVLFMLSAFGLSGGILYYYLMGQGIEKYRNLEG